MLEVIVLGRVPGTSIQITFFQLASVTLCLALGFVLAREIKARGTQLEPLTMKSIVKQLLTAPRVQRFAHKVLALRANISVRRLG